MSYKFPTRKFVEKSGCLVSFAILIYSTNKILLNFIKIVESESGIHYIIHELWLKHLHATFI